MRYLEWSNPQGQRAERQLLGAEGRGIGYYWFVGTGSALQSMKQFGDG